jgi:hypothetical protein
MVSGVGDDLAAQFGQLVAEHGRFDGEITILPPPQTACRSGQGFGALLTLPAPGGDQRGVETFASKERSALGSVEGIVLGQDLRFLLRRELASAR